MIKDQPLPIRLFLVAAVILSWLLRRRFNKLKIEEIAVKPNHSYLLMCNHFSFWDGFLAGYLTYKAIHKKQPLKGFKIMVLKKQMEKNKWLKYFGCFSVSPGTASVSESLNYATATLNEPGNLVLLFPQGKLESLHIRHITFKEGVARIVPKINGDCQLIWSSNLTEYFESLKASVYFNMLDCGTNHDFDFETLQKKVNDHHLKAIQRNFRFTTE